MEGLHSKHSMIRGGEGQSFGTFGELLQGVGSNGDDFLVTLPIQRYAVAKFIHHPSMREIMVSPSTKKKSMALTLLILNHYGIEPGGILEIKGEIPIGKGLASSSADLVATVRALDDCFGFNFTPEQIQFFLKQVEPTDGVMYEGVVSFYHRKVQLREFLGQLPPLTILGIDEGGEVDTVEFNKLPKRFSDGEKQIYDELLDTLSHAVRTGDIHTIGVVSTQSARMNQKIRQNKFFHDVMSICEKVRGLGIVIAHSGTFIGILLSPERVDYWNQISAASEAMQELDGDVMIFHSWSADQKSIVPGRKNTINGQPLV
ncbi:kinase [Aneurinibacillus aneurinilyticus]|uniref:GHMP kinase protein n=2 Tax=Aneurinibacillus aneurinilyticus TaxID=1391 RepID=U1Y456_ANEAE|nr:GHMP kinase protein [Aneurinibacillus aneurinilyticus]ERI05701.1 GHMP kinase protein [Aneurinibacillus aneurinilyticus ATCC 12856]MED0708914.1 kinase [Aneurinibacillus aneurinilyticus]MED0722913.1 kinase [Aneurinibacillus aneurinilyticus]